MFSEDKGRIPERQAAAGGRGWWAVLVLPVDADWPACQHLALWTTGVVFSCLPTHTPVAALSAARTLL